jgi:hypothetical protein
MNNINKDLVTQDFIESIVFWQQRSRKSQRIRKLDISDDYKVYIIEIQMESNLT